MATDIWPLTALSSLNEAKRFLQRKLLDDSFAKDCSLQKLEATIAKALAPATAIREYHLNDLV
jgi:hypothetical protein